MMNFVFFCYRHLARGSYLVVSYLAHSWTCKILGEIVEVSRFSCHPPHSNNKKEIFIKRTDKETSVSEIEMNLFYINNGAMLEGAFEHNLTIASLLSMEFLFLKFFFSLSFLSFFLFFFFFFSMRVQLSMTLKTEHLGQSVILAKVAVCVAAILFAIRTKNTV